MFSERLKQLRRKRGITQIQFAQDFNISKGTIGMWETGRREPDFETATRIADYFHVSMDHLLGRDEKKPAPENGGGLSPELEALIKRIPDDRMPEVERYLRFQAEQAENP